MSGFNHWLSGSLSSVTNAYALPVWVAGALAALLFFVGVLAFARAAQIGRAGAAWRVALLLVGAGLMWVLVGSLGGRDQSAARRLLDARAADLTLRAIAPGSPLACLENVANETIEAACEKSLFASPETIAAAVAYVDAKLTLLADSLELVARDRGYETSIERLRRSIEGDRFGMVAHVLATRGCTAENCAAFKLLRDPRRVVTNLRERYFDANVVLNASSWRPDGPAPAPVAATPASPAIAAAPHVATTGSSPPPAGKFNFPSAASIPAISIMNAEPPLAPGENNGTPPPQAAAPAAPPARAPAPRRQSARETPQAPQASQQTPPSAPSVPMPLAPPGTMSNPR